MHVCFCVQYVCTLVNALLWQWVPHCIIMDTAGCQCRAFYYVLFVPLQKGNLYADFTSNYTHDYKMKKHLS